MLPGWGGGPRPARAPGHRGRPFAGPPSPGDGFPPPSRRTEPGSNLTANRAEAQPCLLSSCAMKQVTALSPSPDLIAYYASEATDVYFLRARTTLKGAARR